MPTPEHEAIVDVFRQNPALLLQIVAKLDIAVPQNAKPKVSEATLNDLQPTEFSADLVIELLRSDRVEFSFILEVQLSIDGRKKFSWPAYATTKRSRTRAQVMLLVVTIDATVTSWAREPIEFGPCMGVFTPLVLELRNIQRITDPKVAFAEPELAFLSAMGHGNDEDGLEVLKALLVGLGGVDHEKAMLYFSAVYRVLRAEIRKVLEAYIMSLSQAGAIEIPAFLQRMLDEREAEGKREGKREGEAKGEAKALLRILDSRGFSVNEEQKKRILACHDLATLDRWLDRVLIAGSVDEVLSDP